VFEAVSDGESLIISDQWIITALTLCQALLCGVTYMDYFNCSLFEKKKARKR
jgi:hypothetical protein